MAVSGMDLSSNWVAGVRVTSKNQGTVGKAQLKNGTGNGTLPTALTNLQDIDDLDNYLAASTAHGAGYYTPKRLAQMNKNDKVHAARLIADPTSLR